MFSNHFAEVILILKYKLSCIVQWMSVQCSRDWPGFNLLPALPKTRISRGAPAMQCITPAGTVLFLNTMQFKRSVVGIQTQHDRAGKKVFSNNFLSWRKKAVWKSTGKNSYFLREAYLCLSLSCIQEFELLILRYTNQVEVLVALPGKTWASFM